MSFARKRHFLISDCDLISYKGIELVNHLIFFLNKCGGGRGDETLESGWVCCFVFRDADLKARIKVIILVLKL